ncbi:argininosuccinate lyase [Orrella sp. JC864]|uniref:argininosuccinate lyase n=1 Tax=Orrella sp. JC864 TaxID=3120298 RepID=UPI00300973E8
MKLENVEHASQVSRRLQQPTADEVCDLIYRPRLQDFAGGFGYLTAINEAHVLMLHKQGLIDAPVAQAIGRALIEMGQAGPGVVELDPQREDAYFNYEAHLIAKVGVDVGGRMHTARSRNDILATMDRMRSRDLVISLLDEIHAVRETALAQAERYAAVVMPGYTHLQPAQPITYGFYLAAVAQALERDGQRLAAAYAHIDRCPMGAGAFAGTPYEIDREETARLLGFPAVIANTMDAVASRDFAFEVLGALAVLAATWSRIAQDYFVWSTDEFGLVDFPDSVAGTSSIMPQKKNPVVLEYLKGRAGQVLGQYTAAIAALKGTNFSHTGDANRESIGAFWPAVQDSLASLRLLRLVLETAAPREDAMSRRARQNFCAATDLADAIVVRAGLSFRQSHHIVGAVVREAMDKGLPADGISLEMVQRAARQQLGRALGLSEEDVRQSLDPAYSVTRRRQGGPAPETVRALAAQARAALIADRQQNQARRQALEDAGRRRRERLLEVVR